MENKLSHFFISTLSIIFVFITSANAEVTLQMRKESEKNLKKLSKQFTNVISREYLTFDDYMKSDERTDVNNKFFLYSYHNCVVPEVPYGDSPSLMDTSVVVFNKSKQCGAKDKFEHVLEINSAGKRKTKDIENFLTSLPVLEQIKYAQFVKINGIDGKISAELRMSENENNFGQPILKWIIKVLCRGKENEQFQMLFLTSDESETRRRLINKDFEIPEDIKKLVASFRCVK